MSVDLVEKIRPILAEGEFSDDRLKAASKAGRGIGSWVRAIIQYYDGMLIVNPAKEELRQAEEKAAAAQALWDAALAQLQKVEAEMKRLVDELDATVAKEKQLRADKESYEKKVDLANLLITSLKSEKEAWEKALIDARAFKENIVGDVLICSGILAYLGVFIKSYRKECVSQWASMMQTWKIQSSPDVSFVNILGDQVKISEWYSQGLPQDEFSTENAIMLEKSERWSLMIDPQMQANIWLKAKHKQKDETLKAVKPNMP
jgi:dynein heavy chain